MKQNNSFTNNTQTEKSPADSDKLKRRSLIERLDLRSLEQSPGALRLSAVAFLLQWLISVIAELLYRHFEPVKGEYSLFICLLLTSLFTFIFAIVAFIELLRIDRAGRSVALALAWINFFAYLVFLYYTRFWLLLFNQFVFALVITYILNGKTTRRRFALAIIFVVLNFLLLFVPAAYYSILRVRAPKLLQIAATERTELLKKYYQKPDAQIGTLPDLSGIAGFEKYKQAVKNAENAYHQLYFMSSIVGEKTRNRAVYLSNWALTLALSGKYKSAYNFAYEAVMLTYVKEAYKNKAKVFALMHKIPYKDYEPVILSESEYGFFEKQAALRKYPKEALNFDDANSQTQKAENPLNSEDNVDDLPGFDDND